MKLTFIFIVILFFTAVRNVEAQQDSVSVVVAVDSAIVIHGYPEYKHTGGRRTHMEREITVVGSDGDTTVVIADSRYVRNRRSMCRHRDHGMERGHRRHRGYGQDEELHEMEAEADHLAWKLRQADAETYDEKEELLWEQLEKIFDYRHAAEMERIEEQKETLEARQKNRNQIIENRLNQLLGRDSLYRW